MSGSLFWSICLSRAYSLTRCPLSWQALAIAIFVQCLLLLLQQTVQNVLDPFSARFPVSLLEPVGASLFLTCPETARKSKMVDLDRNPFVFDFIQTEFYRYGHYRLARQFEIRRLCGVWGCRGQFRQIVGTESIRSGVFVFLQKDGQTKPLHAGVGRNRIVIVEHLRKCRGDHADLVLF